VQKLSDRADEVAKNVCLTLTITPADVLATQAAIA
jgi:hypothetical protein